MTDPVDINQLKNQANDLGKILVDNFDKHRLNPLFTLWGVSFYWGSSGFFEQARSQYKKFVPTVFDLANERSMNATLRTIPKRSGIAFQYTAHCLSNRDLIEILMRDLIDDQDLGEKVQDIISDKRLIIESASRYVSLHKHGVLSEDVDFISYLLRYNPDDVSINMESNEYGGIFVPLGERLLYRFENKAEDSIFSVDHPMLDEASELHQRAVYGKQKLDQELIDMYHDVKKKNTDSDSRTNGSNGIKIDDDSSTKVTKLYFPGMRRVRVRSNSTNVNWEKFFDYRNKELKISSSLNPTEIYINMTKEFLIKEYESKFMQNPEGALNCLQGKIGASKGIKKRVLEEVYETFKGAYELIHSPNLNHNLRLNK